jgi:hypothetical protein
VFRERRPLRQSCGSINRRNEVSGPYVVTETKDDGTTREILVEEAGNQAQAIRHVVGSRYTAKAASAKDVMRLMQQSLLPGGGA